MDEELALNLVQKLRSEYEENAVVGYEIQGETVQNRHQDSFEIRANRIPIPNDWVTGDDIPKISKVNLPSEVSGFHEAERWFLIDQLYQADNVPTVSISEITHNNLIKSLSEVYDPTHLYVPQSRPFLGVQSRQAIREKIEALEVMDELASDSDLTESDVQELADKINESGRKRVEETLE